MSITMLLSSGQVAAMKPAAITNVVGQQRAQMRTQAQRKTGAGCDHTIALGRQGFGGMTLELPAMQRTGFDEEDRHHDPCDGPELRQQCHHNLAEDSDALCQKDRLHAAYNQHSPCWHAKREPGGHGKHAGDGYAVTA